MAAVTSTPLMTFGYTGREAGAGSILYYRARYYEPQRGRFISEDPARIMREGPYGYALRDPVINTDPLGLASKGPAQAHICCDGNGGFAICWDKVPDKGSGIEKCTLEHEKDHIKWLGCHPPYDQLCQGKPKGTKNFQFASKADVNAMECSGYAVQTSA